MNSNFRKQTFFLLLRFRQVFKSDSHLFIFRLSVNWCTEVHSALSHHSHLQEHKIDRYDSRAPYRTYVICRYISMTKTHLIKAVIL